MQTELKWSSYWLETWEHKTLDLIFIFIIKTIFVLVTWNKHHNKQHTSQLLQVAPGILVKISSQQLRSDQTTHISITGNDSVVLGFIFSALDCQFHSVARQPNLAICRHLDTALSAFMILYWDMHKMFWANHVTGKTKPTQKTLCHEMNQVTASPEQQMTLLLQWKM